MQNDFEKEVQQKLEAFSLTPSEDVWQNVASRIAKEKKRRRIVFFWWTAAIILIAGGAGTWLLKTTSQQNGEGKKMVQATKAKEQDQITNSIPRQSTNQKTAVQKQQSKPSNEQIKKKEDEKIIIDKPVASNDNQELNKPNKRVAKRRLAKTKKLYTPIPSRDLIVKQQNKLAELKEKTAQTNTVAKMGVHENRHVETLVESSNNIDKRTNNKVAVQSGKPETEQQIVPSPDSLFVGKEPVKEINKVNDQPIKQDTTLTEASTAKEKPKVKAVKNNKLKFGLTLYTGVSDNTTGFPVLAEKSNLYDYSSAPSNSTGGTSSQVGSPLNFKASFSYGLGVFIQLPISKRWSATAGLDYHYLSATATTGAKVTAQRNLYDSIVNNAVSLTEYYSTAQSNGAFQSVSHFTNKYYLLQFPLNLQLQLNNTNRKPVLLTAGLTPGFLLGSRALYYNRSAQISYTEKDQFQKFRFSGQAGLMFGLSNGKKYSVNLGPQILYDFNNLTKPLIDTRQHLFFFGLKSNITFKPHP